MSAFAESVATLIDAAAKPLAWDETQEAAREVCNFAATVSSDEVNSVLARLRALIRTADIPTAGILALCCGALVEAGGDPALTIEAIADRLPETMALAQKFVDACIKESGENDGDLVADFGDQVREHYPDEANAFHALDPLGLGTIAMLSRSAAVRALVRQRYPELLKLAWQLRAYHERAGFLATMLRVLDCEKLLAIHPELRRGYLLEMTGIGTNFELFILLADVLLGDPASGWLPGERPDPRAAAACRDSNVVAGADSAHGAFNVWNWSALQPDQTLPSGSQMAGSEHWVWMEGVPADIQTLDGLRIVLLGPPPYARILPAGRCFRDMTADLRVTRMLPPTEVEEWLRRISSAPLPRIV
jgi:hypothetical protein